MPYICALPGPGTSHTPKRNYVYVVNGKVIYLDELRLYTNICKSGKFLNWRYLLNLISKKTKGVVRSTNLSDSPAPGLGRGFWNKFWRHNPPQLHSGE